MFQIKNKIHALIFILIAAVFIFAPHSKILAFHYVYDHYCSADTGRQVCVMEGLTCENGGELYQIFPGSACYEEDGSSEYDCDDWRCLGEPILGCTNPSASNYNPLATIDDGGCQFFSNSGKPTILGPSSGVTTLEYNFNFKATDPQGFPVRFKIDWADNEGNRYSSGSVMDGVSDIVWPSFGYVGSEEYTNDMSLTWDTVGNKQFQVKSENTYGLFSDWVTKTINITQLNTTLVSDKSSVSPGDSVVATFANVHNPTQGDWIGVYDVATPDGEPEISYVNTSDCGQDYYSGASPRSDGSCNIIMPTNPGTYNLRIYYRASLSEVMARSGNITVTGAEGGDTKLVTVSLLQQRGGDVVSQDSIIDTRVCSQPCVKEYLVGSNIILTPVPKSSYWKFTGWGGGCSGTGVCSITVNDDVTVTASFSPRLFNYREW